MSDWPLAIICCGDPAKDHVAAQLSRARPDVYYPVGGHNHFRLVLYDEHRVSYVSKVFQYPDKPLVVARVKPDRRLVEHVERADKR